jgi:hypothetical protein
MRAEANPSPPAGQPGPTRLGGPTGAGAPLAELPLWALRLGNDGPPPEYIITRTRLRTPIYDGAIEPILARLGAGTVEEWRGTAAGGLVVLRATVMDPFLAAPASGVDHVAGFVAALRRSCAGA